MSYNHEDLRLNSKYPRENQAWLCVPVTVELKAEASSCSELAGQLT